MNTNGYLCAANRQLMRLAEHELVNMHDVARQLDVTHRRRDGKPHPTKRGKCAYKDCGIDKPARAQHRCGSCCDGRGAYYMYHLPCFFATHRCVMKG